MTSRLTNICIDAADPSSIAHFWCDVLGWEIAEQSGEGISIGPADRAWPVIDILPVPESKTVKNRLHLDLRADGVSTREELERLLGLGASTVDIGQSPDATWVVLADPEGNEFCLLATPVQDFVP
jgi:catechol-2,3-dioxygenase